MNSCLTLLFLLSVSIPHIVCARSKSIPQPKFESVRERCVINGVVALTFDDGPNYQTLKVLETLRELDVKATFFINDISSISNTGDNYMHIDNKTATAIIQSTIDQGHTLLSHTWSHQNLTDGLQFKDIEYQMNHLADKMLSKFGFRPSLMRPPYGELNQTVVDIVGGYMAYEIIMWSIDTLDWSHPGDHVAGLIEYVKQISGTDPTTTLGFISLHHDTLDFGDELAAIVINYVRNAGYRFVSMSECLGIPIKG